MKGHTVKRCCVMLMVVAVLLGGPLVAHGADYGFEIGMNRATQDFDCDGPYKYETDSAGEGVTGEGDEAEGKDKKLDPFTNSELDD